MTTALIKYKDNYSDMDPMTAQALGAAAGQIVGQSIKTFGDVSMAKTAAESQYDQLWWANKGQQEASWQRNLTSDKYALQLDKASTESLHNSSISILTNGKWGSRNTFNRLQHIEPLKPQNPTQAGITTKNGVVTEGSVKYIAVIIGAVVLLLGLFYYLKTKR